MRPYRRELPALGSAAHMSPAVRVIHDRQLFSDADPHTPDGTLGILRKRSRVDLSAVGARASCQAQVLKPHRIHALILRYSGTLRVYRASISLWAICRVGSCNAQWP